MLFKARHNKEDFYKTSYIEWESQFFIEKNETLIFYFTFYFEWINKYLLSISILYKDVSTFIKNEMCVFLVLECKTFERLSYFFMKREVCSLVFKI